MSKPASLPVWATDANYPAGSHGWNNTPTKVAPSGGKQAEGFEPSDHPPAQYINWVLNLIYQWVAWIDAGAWEAVSLVLSGALTVASIVVTGTITAGSTILGTRHLYTTSRARRIPVTIIADNAAANSCTTHARSFGHIVLAASTVPLYAPIASCGTEVVTSYLVSLAKNDNSFAVTSKIVSVLDGVETDETAGTTSGVSIANVALGESGLTLAGGKNYYIKITPGGGNSPGSDHVKSATYSFNEPA